MQKILFLSPSLVGQFMKLTKTNAIRPTRGRSKLTCPRLGGVVERETTPTTRGCAGVGWEQRWRSERRDAKLKEAHWLNAWNSLMLPVCTLCVTLIYKHVHSTRHIYYKRVCQILYRWLSLPRNVGSDARAQVA